MCVCSFLSQNPGLPPDNRPDIIAFVGQAQGQVGDTGTGAAAAAGPSDEAKGEMVPLTPQPVVVLNSVHDSCED